MALSNMQVFNQYLMENTYEELGQMVDAFNAASNGTIVLANQGADGDFFERSFYSALYASQRRVDRYAANGAQASTDLAQLKEASVKIAGGFGPILFEPAQMEWMQKNEAEAIAVISGQLSNAILQDQLNTAIAALVAAIANQGATTTVTMGAALSYSGINSSHALFGDMSGMLQAQVMNGAAYHKLIGDNLTNTPQLFQAQNVTVVDILGKPVIVTDAPALLDTTPTPDVYNVLSLASGAATIMDGSQVVTNTDTSNGKERIETTMQADYDFLLGLKGYTWDTTNGGKSPTDAEIATGTNWDLVATDIKHTAGVLCVGQV